MCTKPLIGRIRNGKMELVKKEWLKEAIWNHDIIDFKNETFLISCGKCKECRLNKMAELKKRIKREASFWKVNTIATLTFNEENKKETFEQVINEMQLFFKRLRKKEEIRYFYGVEKGEKTKRLHVHVIIFNYYPKDAEYYKTTSKNSRQFISSTLNKTWKNGIATFQKLNNASINYVLKYIMKETKTVFKWSKKPPLGISKNENIVKLRYEIKEGKQVPKCYKSYIERKINEKIELTKEAQKLKNQLEEERKTRIEKETGMTYKNFLIKRTKCLTN